MTTAIDPVKTFAIMVVDDAVEVRQALKELLEFADYRVLVADGGLQCLALFERYAGQIGCVLLDMKMPQMDGRQVYAHLRRLDPTVPVVLVSGFAEDEELKSLLDQGLSGYIAKPFTMRQITSTVERMLEARRMN